jgi:hypothetical protein
MNTIFGQNVGLLNVKGVGTCNYQSALKCYERLENLSIVDF